MKPISVLAAFVAGSALYVYGVAHAADKAPADKAPIVNAALNPAADSKPIPPSRSELTDAAFGKLDVGGKGYVTREDAHELDGFDAIFQQNDANHDGRLTPEEFKRAWSAYAARQ